MMTQESMHCLIGITDWHMVVMDFLGSNKFPISSNSWVSESKVLDDCWLITRAAGITDWPNFSSSLLTECNCVTMIKAVIYGSELDAWH